MSTKRKKVHYFVGLGLGLQVACGRTAPVFGTVLVDASIENVTCLDCLNKELWSAREALWKVNDRRILVKADDERRATKKKGS